MRLINIKSDDKESSKYSILLYFYITTINKRIMVG